VSSQPIRVIVADDHSVVREGIRTVLEAADDFDVVAEAATGAQALALIDEHDPDVAILDLTMPEMSGIDVITRLRERSARTSVLILSMHDHPEYVLGAVRAGADGYLLKSAGPGEVRDAVRAVAEGRESFSSRVTQQLSSALRDEAARETSREIAEEFGISHRTVETHRESIMRKLRIRTVAGLTRFALEAGMTE
jgi:DNA-binding NarL/FixJ family response regulator